MKLLTIDIYEAVYHFQLLLQSDGGGGQSAVSAGRPDNLKITSVKLSTLIVGGLILLHYIYKQCNGMQSLCDQLTRGVNLPSIYIYIYIYIYI